MSLNGSLIPKCVIEPPKYNNKFLLQEECCITFSDSWQVPAGSLRIATYRSTDFIPPPQNWIEFENIIKEYNTVYLVFSYNCIKVLNVPRHLRYKVIIVTNPSTFVWNVEYWKFKAIERLVDYPLKIDPKFWHLYKDKHSIIQIASGCQFKCHYCVWNRTLGYKIQWADPIDCAYLSDISASSYLLCPQITGNSPWVIEFLNSRKTNKPFYTDVNCVHIDKYEDDLRKLAIKGLNRAVVGTEAFSDISLKKLGCPHTVEQSIHMISLLSSLNIFGAYQLRRGFGETVEEILETRENLIKIAQDLNIKEIPHKVTVGPIYYWHNSPLMPENKEYIEHSGFPIAIQKLTPEINQVWLDTYKIMEEKGWKIKKT